MTLLRRFHRDSEETPGRPTEPVPGLDDDMWKLMLRAWSSDRDSRPLLSEIVDYLDPMTLFNSLGDHMDLSTFRYISSTPILRRMLLRKRHQFSRISLSFTADIAAELQNIRELVQFLPPSRWTSVTLQWPSAWGVDKLWFSLFGVHQPPLVAGQLQSLLLNSYVHLNQVAAGALLANSIQTFAPGLKQLIAINTPIFWHKLVAWGLEELRIVNDPMFGSQRPPALSELHGILAASLELKRLCLMYGLASIDPAGSTDDVIPLNRLTMLSIDQVYKEDVDRILGLFSAENLDCMVLGHIQEKRLINTDYVWEEGRMKLRTTTYSAKFLDPSSWWPIMAHSKLRMLSLAAPYVSSKLLLRVLDLPRLEVLDILDGVFVEVDEFEPDSRPCSLTILRSGNSNMVHSIGELTGQFFEPVLGPLDEFLNSDFPGVSILKRYQEYLPVAEKAIWYHTPAAALPPLSREDRAKFTRIFDNTGPYMGLLPAGKARGVMLKSRLPTETVDRILRLADSQRRDHLDLADFIVGMYFVQAMMNDRLPKLPATLPEELYAKAAVSRSDISSPSSPFSPFS
ncbi:hypothetical protein CALCODRAFT_354352 [Calocera cornea HHB12733]|uniref:EH domain-containing protein n=1 Tax=Calocera cornea HHB12733 TaxID=1353952 RepID=A0A165ER08_9BASI|nr:hypothetical protein CALCODRAFT_354352 [Calocera cornea HHB12733]